MPADSILVLAPTADPLRDELAQRAPLADGPGPQVRIAVTSGATGIDAAAMDALPALAMIAVFGVGYDKVDMAHARARGIAVSNTPDVLTDDVADMAVALTYAAARRIAANDRFVREGRWAAGGSAPFGWRLTGRRIGIIGLGRIGRAIATRLAPVAGTIAYHNRRPVADCSYAYHDSAAGLATASDVLILAASSAAGEPPIVDAPVLDALGPDGLFVNIARGRAVDEGALVRALTDRRILAAGLDVFADEPHVPAALLALDSVTLQPHQGSATPDTRAAMGALVLANIDAFLAGAPLPSAV